VRQLTNAGGQATLAQSYDPFGNLFEAAGSGASEFGYTGEQVDAGTELVFLRARYYDPQVSVFLRSDSFPGIPFNPGTVNGYNYANQNPVNLTDRSGYSPDAGNPITICFQSPGCPTLLTMGGTVVGVTVSPVMVVVAVPGVLTGITYFVCGPHGCAPEDTVILPGPVPEPPAPAPPRDPPLPGVTPMPPFPDTTGTGEDPFSLPPIYQRAPDEDKPEPDPTASSNTCSHTATDLY
jgi:RHS repeat-associated protein